jgi:hypothetical protein
VIIVPNCNLLEFPSSFMSSSVQASKSGSNLVVSEVEEHWSWLGSLLLLLLLPPPSLFHRSLLLPVDEPVGRARSSGNGDLLLLSLLLLSLLLRRGRVVDPGSVNVYELVECSAFGVPGHVAACALELASTNALVELAVDGVLGVAGDAVEGFGRLRFCVGRPGASGFGDSRFVVQDVAKVGLLEAGAREGWAKGRHCVSVDGRE